MVIDLLFAGYPKAGSTALVAACSEHPEINLRFKTNTLLNANYVDAALRYHREMDNDPGKINVEFDERILAGTSRDYVPMIARARKLNDAIKVVACIRNQRSRLISAWKWQLRTNNTDFLTFKGFLGSKKGRSILARADYAHVFSNVLEIIPRDQLYVIVFEKFREDPVAELNRLFRFAGVSPLPGDFVLKGTNPAPSPISVALLGLTNYTCGLLSRTTTESTIKSAHVSFKYPPSPRKNILDRGAGKRHKLQPICSKQGQRLLWRPFLSRLDPTLSRWCRKLNFDLTGGASAETVSRFFHDSNRELEALLGMDLEPYGY